jgi:uncharacterized protein
VSRETQMYAQVPPAPNAEGDGTANERVPWGLLDCVGVFAVTAVAVIGTLVLLGALDAAVGLPEQVNLVMLPLPLVLLGVVTLLWVHLRHRAMGTLSGRARNGAKELVVGAGLGVGAFFAVNVGLSILLQVIAAGLDVELPVPQEGLRDAAIDPSLLPVIIVSAVVVAPLAEEVFFRGMLFQALGRFVGRWGAIIVSAAVFAAAHVLAEPTWLGGALVFSMILPLGVALAWVFDRRGSLASVIAMHASFNALTVATMVLAARSGILAS